MIQAKTHLESGSPPLRQGISGISTYLVEINKTIHHGFNDLERSILKGFIQVSAQLGDDNEPAPTEATFYLLIALNVLEDIVLDQTFDLARANKSLEKRRGEPRFYADRLQKMPEELKDSFANLFRNFSSSDFSYRSKRFVEIGQFRKRLLWSFVPQESEAIAGAEEHSQEEPEELLVGISVAENGAADLAANQDSANSRPSSSEINSGDVDLSVPASENSPKAQRRKR